MNSEEAKDILQLCRPDHIEDLNDPLITEALEKLEQDSNLCAWFEEQQMVDAEISAELGRIMPAANLKESILSGMQERFESSENGADDAPAEKDFSTRPAEQVPVAAKSSSKILWFRPLIGLAAVFLFASLLFVHSRRESAPSLADQNLPADDKSVINSSVTVAGIPDIIQFLGHQIADFDGSKFDKRSERVDELQTYLASSNMPNPSKIPQRLEAAPTIGCVTFDYGGTKMSMICFRNGKVYHLITVNKTDLNGHHLLSDNSSEAKFFEHREQAFKVWSEGDKVYIFCTKGTKKDIPEFI